MGEFKAKSIQFVLSSAPIEVVTTPAVDVFQFLMQKRLETNHLPGSLMEFDTHDPPRPLPENQIFNRLLIYCGQKKLGFTLEAMESGRPNLFFKKLSACFFKLSDFFTNLSDKHILGSQIVPQDFEILFGFKANSAILHQTKRILSFELLLEVEEVLVPLLENNLFLKTKLWGTFNNDLQKFSEAIHIYKSYNQKNRDRKSKNKGRVKDPEILSGLLVSEVEGLMTNGDSIHVDDGYHNLNKKFNEMAPYTSLSLTDYFPSNHSDNVIQASRNRKAYIENLQLHRPLHLVSYDTKNRYTTSNNLNLIPIIIHYYYIYY